MKIGILTYHRAHNYGAVLQAYALKKHLEKYSSEVEIIDYWPDYRAGMYETFDSSYLKQNFSLFVKTKKTVRQCILLIGRLIRAKRFDQFIKSNLDVVNRPFKSGNSIPDDLDVIFIGSDQVWRYNDMPSFKGFDAVYWGEFPKSERTRKYTYGASMGVIVDNDESRKFISRQINNFQRISVREEDLKQLIKMCTKQHIERVLDPVFLLSRNDWKSIVPNKKKIKGKYLVLYNILSSKRAQKIAKVIAKEKGLQVIEITAGVGLRFNPGTLKQTYGPLEYLQLLKEASFIISSSFHGVAFALLFQKNFYALGMKNNSNRVTNLLESLNIGERYLSENINSIGMEDVDYKKVDELLDAQIDYSKRFISEIFKD